MKNKNWGKEDTSWVKAEQDRIQEKTQDKTQDKIQDKLCDMQKRLLSYCNTPRSLSEILIFMEVKARKNFRNEIYPEYKANRLTMPDSLREQLDLIQEGLKAFDIPIYTYMGYEGDDVIGTISRQACELGHNVLILTGDQDSFQLIRKNGCVKVIIPSKGELIEYDWNKVYEKLGVYPDQVIDYKALRGDTSDNIPGIKGIGEKTAVRLLDEFKTVDNVLANAENIEGDAIKDKIKKR